MKAFHIGVPEEDATLLISGISGPNPEKAPDINRWLGEKARLLLPIPAGTTNRVILSLSSAIDQELSFALAGRKIKEVKLKGDKKWNEVTLDIPANLPALPELEITAAKPHAINEGFIACCAMLRTLSVEKETAVPRPLCYGRTEPHPAYKHFFGDIHAHTNLSPCAKGNGSNVTENCRYAQEVSRQDFIAIVDHDSRMTVAQWRETMDELVANEKPGKFVALFGYEWTDFLFGQMNVYSPSPDLPLFPCTSAATNSPTRLWKALKDWKGKALTIFHHSTRPGMPVNWDFWDEEMMPVVEMHSFWGNSEYYGAPCQKAGLCVPGTTVQDALARGYRLGFVGGTDSHNRMPGSYALTGVLAESLSRDSVFEAIKARRCYATTGAHIELDFKVNGHLMGSVLPFNPYTAQQMYPLKIEYRVKGTAPLSSIEVVTDGGVVIHRRSISEMEFSRDYTGGFELANAAGEGRKQHPCLTQNRRYLYLRVVQAPGSGGAYPMSAVDMAWSSPVFLAPDYSAFV